MEVYASFVPQNNQFDLEIDFIAKQQVLFQKMRKAQDFWLFHSKTSWSD